MNATKAKYFDIFKMLANATHEGVPGVICIDSGVPGPVLGITTCTHGNEPAGLAACDFLLNKFDIQSKLKAGKVYLVLNNIEAARKYFDATSKDEKGKARSVDFNMNRIPKKAVHDPAHKQYACYEAKRVRELMPIWSRFTAALDIHSMTSEHIPMVITKGDNFEQIKPYIKGFPIEILITNIDTVQKGLPVFSFYGNADESPIVFGVEAGQHEHAETFNNAKECVLALMKNLGMVSGRVRHKEIEYIEYKIVDSITFKSRKPDLAAMFRNFEFVPKGAKLVVEGGVVVERAQMDCQLFFPSMKRGDEKSKSDIQEEISFISLPAKLRLL